jgi:MerR family transcriptional regulator, copper efflux regulator
VACRVLSISASGFYEWRGRKPSARQRADEQLSAMIAQIHERSRDSYGSPRVYTELRLGQVLGIRDSGQPPCAHVTALIAQRLAEVEARLSELARTRDQLAALAGRAAAQDPARCSGYCSIITS